MNDVEVKMYYTIPVFLNYTRDEMGGVAPIVPIEGEGDTGGEVD